MGAGEGGIVIFWWEESLHHVTGLCNVVTLQQLHLAGQVDGGIAVQVQVGRFKEALQDFRLLLSHLLFSQHVQ